jgi:hypothetical protein
VEVNGNAVVSSVKTVITHTPMHPVPHVIQSHAIFPEIQDLKLPTISTTRAAKPDREGGAQRQGDVGPLLVAKLSL